MTNKKVLRTTTLTIGDKEYTLQLPFGQAKKLEKAIGGSILKKLMAMEEDLLDLDFIAATIRHSLRKHHGEMSEDTVDDLIQDYIDDSHNLIELMQVSIEVIQNSGFLDSAK